MSMISGRVVYLPGSLSIVYTIVRFRTRRKRPSVGRLAGKASHAAVVAQFEFLLVRSPFLWGVFQKRRGRHVNLSHDPCGLFLQKGCFAAAYASPRVRMIRES